MFLQDRQTVYFNKFHSEIDKYAPRQSILISFLHFLTCINAKAQRKEQMLSYILHFQTSS